MIADQVIGKSFMGALNYNLKKLYHPDPKMRAELLDNNFTSIDSKMIQQELRLVRSLRPNLNRYVYHTSLNFSKADILDNKKILNIAHDYLKESGYTNNQYFIFRHHDARHPHIHLLVNRITFDGNVVSDSNNYKKSEAVLRKLEEKYDLERIEPGQNIPFKAATKDELEMVTRRGKPSEKMLLQELMKKLTSQKNISIQEMISKGEQSGIHFLFNRASTGKISGITYFHNGFKIKGQQLGERFKWAELIKNVNYEQIRDGEAIGQANSRTTAIYGNRTAAAGQRTGGSGVVPENTSGNSVEYTSTETTIDGLASDDQPSGSKVRSNEEGTPGTGQGNNILDTASGDYGHDSYFDFNIEISDDEDDAKKRRRGMQR